MENIKERLNATRRVQYVSGQPCEDFIVPLLAGEISRALSRAKSARGLRLSKALDAGCGMQPFRAQISAAGFQYFGSDVIQNATGTVDFIGPLDAELLPVMLATGPFDLILCTEVLEHVADWNRAFSNFNRLTDNGSQVIVTCPAFYMLHERPYDFWRPTIHAIEFFAERHRFKVIELTAAGDPWDVLGTLLGSVSVSATSRSFYSRAIAKIARVGALKMHSMLKSNFLRSHVKLEGEIYLSNIAVLERLPS